MGSNPTLSATACPPVKVAVTVVPRARTTRVEALGPGRFRVAVPAAAKEGKANAALIAALAEYFAVPRSRVRILRGHAARQKVVEIG